MLKPELLHDADGYLYIRVSDGDIVEMRQVPKFKVPHEFHAWIKKTVPKMLRQLTKKRTARNEVVRRMGATSK